MQQRLYTSLVRLKQAMNGGHLPPMTPVTGKATRLIDPAFTIGLGALEEDTEKGLRCPVRECGRYYHQLGIHLNTTHRNIGGRKAVLRALDIPTSTGIVSQAFTAKVSDKVRERLASYVAMGKIKPAECARTARQARDKRAGTRMTMASRNLRNKCTAQLSHRLIDLEKRIGRSPSHQEAEALEGRRFVNAVVHLFGTWNAAKAQCGLEVYDHKGGHTVPQILDALRSYYAINGSLPSSEQARHPTRRPLIPNDRAILRAFGCTRWRDAMEQAASLLGIQGGRYGLRAPYRKSA